MNHSLSTAFTESHTFGLLCLYFHLILCIFWFPCLILPWSVGYSVACCVGSFSSVQSFSRVKKWLHVLQHDRLPCQHQPPEFTQTHVHRLGEAKQPSHLMLSPSFPAFNLSQHQGLFNGSALLIRWQSIGVSDSLSVLPINIQDWYPLGFTGWIFLQSKGLSRVFSNTTVQKHQFFHAQFSL